MLFSLALTAVASSPSKLSSSKVGPALKLRGGGVSAADAQTVVAGLMGLSSGIGYVYTDDMAKLYEFTDPVTPQTKFMSKMTFGSNAAAAVLLLKPEYFVVAMAGVVYSLADQAGEVLDMPRYPMVAFAILPLVIEWAMAQGHLPKWALGAFLMTHGAASILAWEVTLGDLATILPIYSLYQAKVKSTKQSECVGKFFIGNLLAQGIYLVSQANGHTAAQSFGYWSTAMTAAGVKFALVDGKGVFNPVGGYVWIALYAAAAGIALTA